LKVERNIVAPFFVFGIVMGIAGVIILPTANAFFQFSEETYNRLFDMAWAGGALIALLYSLIVLKEFLQKSLAEKFLYCFLAIVFVALLVFPFFR